METLFWLSSKIIWEVISPYKFLYLVLLMGVFLLYTQRNALGLRLVLSVTVFIFVLNIFPIDNLIMAPLEDRFPFRQLPKKVDGIIVLGGAADAGISAARKQPTVNGSAERLFAFIFLARQYPRAKLVFSGGSGAIGSKHKHSDAARIIFEQSGIDINRIIFESKSKNTYENAVHSYDLVKPKKGEIWILITSAFHMPRSVGVFRKANWEVFPYPVDYRTLGSYDYVWDPRGFEEIKYFTPAVREWLGLLAYRVTGKTNQLFPTP